jgi:predicted lysophospholipase L1 biosynthesis ABC-type transport system permease subunit
LIVLMLWLAVIFLVFALTSPRHAVMQVVIALSALSLASVMYVILELDTPFSGTMMVSSTPLRDALAHIDRPAGSVVVPQTQPAPR